MGKRILAFLIDHIIICFAFVLLGMAGMVEMSLQTDFEFVWKIYYLLLQSFMFIYFFKDVINGQSIGKRIMEIRVVDLGGNKPKLFNLVIRNITILIWPVEAILVLLDKERLGDRLAKTRVVDK